MEDSDIATPMDFHLLQLLELLFYEISLDETRRQLYMLNHHFLEYLVALHICYQDLLFAP